MTDRTDGMHDVYQFILTEYGYPKLSPLMMGIRAYIDQESGVCPGCGDPLSDIEAHKFC